MTARLNRAIELLAQDQPIYYMGGHTGHVLTYEQGKLDAHTWADYIKSETLSEELTAGLPPVDAYQEMLTIEGETLTLGVQRA